MNDTDCVAFLQWALPRLELRWAGFRRVRGQVCKRITRRIQALGLSSTDAYRAYLSEHATEWNALDALCTIPISRFYRDRAVFDALGEQVLPALADRATARTPAVIRCWSAGCASGEEPYTLRLLWDQRVRSRYPQVSLAIVATDVDKHLLERARSGCYARSSLRELPPDWVDRAFDCVGGVYCLREQWKAGVEWCRQDIRQEQPAGMFDLVLCRNLVFTYFSGPLQRAMLARIVEHMRAEGFLVLGRHESLPSDTCLLPWAAALGIYRNPA